MDNATSRTNAPRRDARLHERLALGTTLAAVEAHSKLITSFGSGRNRVHDASQFAWTEAFEQNSHAIRGEAMRLLPGVDLLLDEHDLFGTKVHVPAPADWKLFALYGAKEPVVENCRRCPITASMCERVPGLLHAFFSILKPHTHIASHRGKYNGKLRYHLGLKIPSPRGATRMRVESEMLYWEEHRHFVFDDTYEHEVWNDSDENRIVLIMDFVRPLPPVLDGMNRAFLEMLMQVAARRGRSSVIDWEKTHGRDLDALIEPGA